jgi:hypothetical protein
MSVDIVGENSLPSTYNFGDMHGSEDGTGTTGFSREISVNVGETVHFCVNGASAGIWIYRTGYYSDAKGFREVARLVNTTTNQPELTVIPGSNGGTTATGWSTTASWPVPANAVSGMYMAMIRNPTNTDAFYVTFVVRDDAAQADIIYKTSDTTWGAAYNHYGTKANIHGGDVYGTGGALGAIQDRTHAVDYHRPVLTMKGCVQTFWWACELPLIRWLERNGYTVKYITSADLDKYGRSLLQKGKIFISSGHDEYWTTPMRDAVENWRDLDAGKSLFLSGNEVFWRARFVHTGDRSTLWCYKDTMPGPGSHAPGTPLDPVTWTGTWADTRWPERRPEWLLTGDDFGMNGVYDYDAIVPKNPYGGHKVWGGSALVDQDVTFIQAMGFEAQHVHPTQPEESVRYLARYTRSAPGGLADANGENYNVQGDIDWGIVSQRYASGGLTVGFGTCQWAWTLDNTHDRGSVPPNPVAQQMMVTLLRDLGAEPGSLRTGTLQPKNSLDVYGLIPGGVVIPPDPPAVVGDVWYGADGTAYTPHDYNGNPMSVVLT